MRPDKHKLKATKEWKKKNDIDTKQIPKTSTKKYSSKVDSNQNTRLSESDTDSDRDYETEYLQNLIDKSKTRSNAPAIKLASEIFVETHLPNVKVEYDLETMGSGMDGLTISDLLDMDMTHFTESEKAWFQLTIGDVLKEKNYRSVDLFGNMDREILKDQSASKVNDVHRMIDKPHKKIIPKQNDIVEEKPKKNDVYTGILDAIQLAKSIEEKKQLQEITPPIPVISNTVAKENNDSNAFLDDLLDL